jgi:hypothetical protein
MDVFPELIARIEALEQKAGITPNVGATVQPTDTGTAPTTDTAAQVKAGKRGTPGGENTPTA